MKEFFTTDRKEFKKLQKEFQKTVIFKNLMIFDVISIFLPIIIFGIVSGELMIDYIYVFWFIFIWYLIVITIIFELLIEKYSFEFAKTLDNKKSKEK